MAELGVLRCRFESADHRPILFVAGELDLATSNLLKQALDSVRRTDALCLDLDDCQFIDSTGLRTILEVAHEFRNSGGELSVRGLQGQVGQIFEITGLLLPGSAILHVDGNGSHSEVAP